MIPLVVPRAFRLRHLVARSTTRRSPLRQSTGSLSGVRLHRGANESLAFTRTDIPCFLDQIHFFSTAAVADQAEAKARNIKLDQKVGLVTKIITYRKGGWCAAMVTGEDKTTDDCFKVVGEMPKLRKGGIYEFHGKWSRHSEHGRQLSVQRYTWTRPKETEWLKEYLAKFVPNVGETLAGRVVNHFLTNAETIQFLLGKKKEGNLNHSVKGISEKLNREIVKHCQDNKHILDVLVRLAPLGITPLLCQRIGEKYGKGAMKVIESDPYALVEMRGLNFRDADAIALSNPETSPESSQRIGAAVDYLFGEESAEGHTAQELGSLVGEMSQLLDVDRVTVKSKIQDLPSVECCAFSGKEYLQFKDLAKDERTIAEFFKTPRRKQSKLEPSDLMVAAKACGYEEFSDSQKEAITALVETGTSVITGGPGCGKSAIIPAVLSLLPTKKIHVVAPTGRAAQRLNDLFDSLDSNVFSGSIPLRDRVEATTIHRRLMYGFAIDCQLVILDEASMIDTELLAELICELPRGCNLVLVGDTDQLPSIGPGKVLDDIIRSAIVPVTRLDRVYRQESESAIVDLAQHVNEGKFEKSFVHALQGDQLQFVQLGEGQSLESALDDILQGLPQQYGPTDIQVLAPMKIKDHGIEKINDYFQNKNDGTMIPGLKSEIGDKVFEFKVGDKVIQTRNNYDLRLFNGMVGVVVEDRRKAQEYESCSITVDFDGTHVKLEDSALDDLQLAYAITVHKSQGGEYPVVIVVLTMKHSFMLQRKLIYTAFTRPKEKLIVVGHSRACELAAQKNQSNERCTLLLQKLLQTP